MRRNCRLAFLPLVLLLSAFLSPCWPEAIPEDRLLTIPREDAFDELKEVTVEEVNKVKLYDRYPATWKVIDITEKWTCGPLKTDVQLSEHELEVRKVKAAPGQKKEDPFLKPTEEGAERGVGSAEAEAAGEEDLKTPSKGRAEDLTTEEIQAEIDKVRQSGKPVVMPKNPRAMGADAQNMAAVAFSLENALDPERQSCLLHFNRGCFTAVYVNLKKAHGRANSFCPLTIDITAFVRQGENVIAMLEGPASLNRGSEILLAPVRYVSQLLLATQTGDNTLSMDLQIRNNGPAYKGQLVAKINSYGSKENAFESSKAVELKTGDNALTWTMNLQAPVCWSPDNPHLYELQLYDEPGHALWKERFGFRDFKARGRHFYLNGQRIKLFGNCGPDYEKGGYLKCIEWGPGEYLDTYEKRACYAYLKGLKAAGLNANLLYGSKDMSRGYFEVCDELGILAYVHFPAWGERLKTRSENPRELLSPMWMECERYLYHLHNHACFAMLSLGAELYDALPENLAVVYDHLKPLDRQARPLCSSTGRIRVQLNLRQKDKTDVADDHSYWGTLKGAWHWNRGYFATLRKDVDAMYGKDTLPLTSFECLDASWRYDCFNVSAGVVRLLTAPKLDKNTYVRLMEADVFGEPTPVLRLCLSHGHGLRKYYTDEVYAHQAMARTWQRIIEIYRQEDVLDGWGAFHIEQFIRYAFENSNTLAAVKKAYPDVNIERTGVDITKRQFVKLPAYTMVKRCYNPEFLSAKWFDRNLTAGSGAVRATLYLTKDSIGSHAYTARVLFRDTAGQVVEGKTYDFGRLTDFEIKTAEYEFPIPAGLPAGDYRLELYLFREGKQVNDNHYPVRVFSPEMLTPKLQTDKAVAVYFGPSPAEKAPAKDGKPDSKAMFDAMGFKYAAIEDLTALGPHKVLILAADSLDDRVAQAGDAIRKWVESGGRLLAMEQSRVGALPWLPEMKVIRTTPNVNADLVDDRHPALQGLRQEDFDSWNGSLCPYTNLLDPLNGTVVAAAPSGYVLRPPFMKAALVDVALNEGICVVSQFDATKRYGQDGVATILANNLVRHILSDERRFSYTVAGKRNIAVNPAHCRSIDLSKVANAGFKAEEGEEEDDELGGGAAVVGQGAAKKDLRNFPVSRKSFVGIPFKILQSGDKGGNTCVQLDLVGEPESVPVKARFSKLFFLHTALRCEGKNGASVYAFTMNYADGKSETLEIKKGLHVSAQPHLDSLPDSLLAWGDSSGKLPTVGVYVTEWENPRPEAEISSIECVLTVEGVAIVVAITGYWDADEHGWK